MNNTFGTIPYRALPYGPPEAIEDSELIGSTREVALLKVTLEKLKLGKFDEGEKLLPLLTHQSYDIRQYSQQLFAHVCNHRQVHQFTKAIECISDSSELFRVILRLGETLSPSAIPLLMSIRRDFDETGLDDDLRVGLNVILSSEQTDRLLRHENRADLELLMALLDPNTYYYRGNPVFVGDVTKELVTAAIVANRENKALITIRQTQILSNFSGIECPVQSMRAVSDNDVYGVFDYVARLAKMNWKRGVKYFYGYAID